MAGEESGTDHVIAPAKAVIQPVLPSSDYTLRSHRRGRSGDTVMWRRTGAVRVANTGSAGQPTNRPSQLEQETRDSASLQRHREGANLRFLLGSNQKMWSVPVSRSSGRFAPFRPKWQIVPIMPPSPAPSCPAPAMIVFGKVVRSLASLPTILEVVSCDDGHPFVLSVAFQ